MRLRTFAHKGLKLLHAEGSVRASPPDTVDKLRKMLEIFGLNFGAFDIIRDDDDELYFIELNPNGQWYWIEILTQMPMVKAMADLITELANG